MASTDPSRRASFASSEASLVDPAIVARMLPKKDSIVGKVKIKKPVPKPKPENNDENARSASPESPLMNDIDPDLRATFASGRPMEDKADLIQCKHCKKPMLKAVAASHIQICLQKKLDRAQRKKEQKEAARKAREAREKGKDEDGDVDMEDSVTLNSRVGGDGADSVNGDKTGKKTSVGDSEKSKKRKAETEGEKEPKKKKTKKEIEAAKPKIPKPKGPVDVEKQCGVLLPNGAYCARSLTCKSHAMGAKRAVPGRSLPYDMLLAAYQKKNQAKQQKAAIDANAPLPDDVDASGPIDSDEEKDAVMAGIARSRPQPLAQHIHVPVRKKYQYLRMKEMLSQGLSGIARANGVSGSGYGGHGVNGLYLSGPQLASLERTNSLYEDGHPGGSTGGVVGMRGGEGSGSGAGGRGGIGAGGAGGSGGGNTGSSFGTAGGVGVTRKASTASLGSVP